MIIFSYIREHIWEGPKYKVIKNCKSSNSFSCIGKSEASNEVKMSDYDHYDIRPACKTSLGRINCDIYQCIIMPEVYLSMAYL